MRFVTAPSEISIAHIKESEACLSPSRYTRFIVPEHHRGSSFVPLDSLVQIREQRTGISKGEWYRYAEIGDISVHDGDVAFRWLRGFQVPTSRPAIAETGDVLISTVRTYRGGVGLVLDTESPLITSNAILNLCDVNDPGGPDLLYIYAFLRSEFFLEQVWALLNRGLYPRMDRGALDRILIPVSSDIATREWISQLALTIAEKALQIRLRHQLLMHSLLQELTENQKVSGLPVTGDINIHDMIVRGRLDAAIFGREFRAKSQLIEDYTHGHTDLSGAGFTAIRGQNLQVSCIGKSVYSSDQRTGFYRLILPTHISAYGTIAQYQWLGNPRPLEKVQQGDIIFGAEATFRSCVVSDAVEVPTITNIHGIILRSDKASIHQRAVVGAWLRFLGEWGYSEILAAGGQGGSLAFDYLKQLKIPNFPAPVVRRLAEYYTSDPVREPGPASIRRFSDWHRQHNPRMGIWELDREMKELQAELGRAQERVIAGYAAEVPAFS